MAILVKFSVQTLSHDSDITNIFMLKVMTKNTTSVEIKNRQMKTVIVITVITDHYLCSLLGVFIVLGTAFFAHRSQVDQTLVYT